jgi:uncharacterized protein YbjT (DUF2867 family)
MALVTVFGGAGFLGRHIVESLARDGGTVRIAVRHPAVSHGDQRASVTADIRDESAVAVAVAGADAVVNAVSAYVEGGGITYRDVHELAPAMLLAPASSRASGTSSMFQGSARIRLRSPAISAREAVEI